MAYLLGYCELTFANANNNSDAWLRASSTEKNFAITMGRIYIDEVYTCLDSDDWDTTDYTTIPDEVQLANSMLAEEYISGTLIDTDVKTSGPVTKKKVKAGPVESETTYKGYYSRSGSSVDEHPYITMLLSPYCTYGNSGNDLIRV